MRFITNLIRLILVLSVYVCAQIHNLRFENYTDIIPARIVYCIYQDSQGFLWFGSAGEGLIRYDGINCKVYQQVRGYIRVICEQQTAHGRAMCLPRITHLACRNVPDGQSTVPHPNREELTVRRKRHAGHTTRLWQRGALFQCLGIPQFDLAILTTRGKQPAIGRKCQTLYEVPVASKQR